MIRPQPADWFEIIGVAADAGELRDSLAGTGCAEIEPVAICQEAALPAPGIYTRITGWTSDAPRLAECIDQSNVRAIVHFPPAPAELLPPLVLRNPGWIQPFEIFARLVGMPGRFSADPSGLLVFVAPIMFGYMFGDVIQGLALIAVGLALQWRWPMLRLLVVGGISTIGFGFVFGAAGGIHGLVSPLWLSPLDNPLPVLLVPIAFGGALLTLGLALTGLEAYWRGRLRNWLCCDAGFLILYLGLLLTLLHPAGQVLVALGLGMHVFGKLRQTRQMGAMLASFGELVEKLIQILINTLSFIRVGAFALAHAGLSSALISMVEAVDSPTASVVLLVAGNILIIVIEVLVASVQTTRLVLFEFFTRFLQSNGREFHPLSVPSGLPEEIQNVSRT